MSGKRLNVGELMTSIIQLTTDNDKIIEDIDPKEMANNQMQQEQMMDMQGASEQGEPPQEQAQDPEVQQDQVNLQAVMQEHGVDENTAMAMLEAEKQGFDPEEIFAYMNGGQGEQAQ